MTFRRFEDINAWRTARTLRTGIYALTRGRKFAADFSLKDQIRRATVSVMSNIAEGFVHRSDKQFAQYLRAAKASLAEIQSQLYAAFDESYITNEQFKHHYSLAEICSKQLAGLISYLVGPMRQNSVKTTPDASTPRHNEREQTPDTVDTADSPDVAKHAE